MAASFLSIPFRQVLIQIHSSRSDKYSWIRYSSSFVLIMSVGIAVYQATYSDINIGAISLLVGIAFTGKVAQTSINKDK